ncbi:MAG: endonuclease/exonuclease/phosphatase family protein [Planctomycetaceae bacterium]
MRFAMHQLCNFAFIAICVFTVTGRTAVADDASDDRPPSTAVSVRSFNIRYGTANDGPNHWDRRRELVIQTIKKTNPDLLGTQETLAFQRDYLLEQLPEYAAEGVGRDDGGDRGEMAALFYRKARFTRLDGGSFWLSTTPDEPGSVGWDAALPRVCTWVKLQDRQRPDAAPLWFFNVHFDHKGSEARVESSRLLAATIRDLCGDEPVVVTGDFNAGEGSEPYRAFYAQPAPDSRWLDDTYRVVHPRRQEHEGTATGFNPESFAGSRIDWIASRGWKVESASINHATYAGRAPSDHWPVEAVLLPLE